MTKTLKKTNSSKKTGTRVFILDFENETWFEQFDPDSSIVCSDEADVVAAVKNATKNSLWISSHSDSTEKFLCAMRDAYKPGFGEPQRGIGTLLMLESPRAKTIPFLSHWFAGLVGETSSFKVLPRDQLVEVLSVPEKQRQDLFIGGTLDRETGLLSLIRGNLKSLSVPLSIFRPCGSSRPNFQKFELDDYGHTIRFGEFEVAADFVLFEACPEYRRRMNAKRRNHETGFGASLRRLRVQRGLSRDDFPGVSAKTLARIERGEVDKPQGKTLTILSKRLGVNPDEIESY